MPVTLAVTAAFSLLAAAVWAWVNFAGGRGRSLHYRLDPDPPARPPGGGPWPRVTLVAPGRNEAAHLPAVLPRLCGQSYPRVRHRVVFVDDASSDRTPAIVARFVAAHPHLLGVRLEGDPPPGWMGKCHAVHRGVAAADAGAGPERGHDPEPDADPWLCFTDADILWHPDLLRCAVAYALEHDADLLGVTPTLTFGSTAEAVVQLQLVLALGVALPFEKAMDPETPWALTGGAFILVRRRFYDAIGGHAAVRGEMVEDLKLGMALKAAGARHRVAVAGDLQTCRMYDGVADMWAGLTKNAYAGLNHRWYVAASAVLAVATLNVLPPLYAGVAAAWLLLDPRPLAVAALLAAVAAVLLQARALNAARKLMRLPVGYAWTLNAGSAAYAAILLASAWRYHRGGNRWAGRTYGARHAAAARNAEAHAPPPAERPAPEA